MVQLWPLKCPVSKGPVVQVNFNKGNADKKNIWHLEYTKSTPRVALQDKIGGPLYSR